MTPAPSSPGPAVHLAALLTRVARSDRKAFGELYVATAPHLYGVALRILKSESRAEDVVQETFVGLWQFAASYEAATHPPLIWLTAIVRSRCLDQLRERQRLASEAGAPGTADDPGGRESAGDATLPATSVAGEIASDATRAWFDALDPGRRRAILLAFHGGLTRTEIAREMDLPPATVRAWMRDALERLAARTDGSLAHDR